jgi:molybdopterin-guanine dinucleotide biosynthesis protein A
MIAGVILAGGAATRLGGVDKPLLTLGDGTLLDVLLARVRPQVAALAISANGDPVRYARFGLPVLADEMLRRGPLGGVLSGLGWAARIGAEVLLSVPGDTPFVPVDLVARLGAAGFGVCRDDRDAAGLVRRGGRSVS